MNANVNFFARIFAVRLSDFAATQFGLDTRIGTVSVANANFVKFDIDGGSVVWSMSDGVVTRRHIWHETNTSTVITWAA